MGVVCAYGTETPDIDFGKVSEEELKMSHCKLDSSASAVVLADFGKTEFSYNQASGIQMVFTRHRRIKIFNSSGYDWADVAVLLYKDGREKEVISQVKGYTYHLEDDKVVKTKLKSEGKFLEEYDDNHDIYKFTLPNVKEGSVIEYTYRVTSDFLFNLQDWEFQASIPTLWSEYDVTIPEYFIYKPLFQGYYSLAINDQSPASGRFNITVRSQSGGGGLNSAPVRRQTRQEQVDFQATNYHWAAQDIPALVEELYVTTMDDYVMKMELELSSTKFPGEPYKNYTTSWEEIDRQLLESSHFGDILKRSGSIKNQVATLTAGTGSDAEKAARIYQYVQQQIRWNQHSRLFAEQTLKQTLETQSGNSADLNLLLTAMLREADIKAEPVALSTRDHGMLRQEFPRLTQYNYVVSLAWIDDQPLLLDATDPNCSWDMLPIRCLNYMGRIISKESGEKWINLQPDKGSLHTTMATLSLAEGQLKGTIATSRSGYNAMRLRKNIVNANGVDGYLTQMKSNQHSWTIDDYEVTALETLDEPLKETYEVELSEVMQEAGDMIYLTPVVLGRLDENPFKSESRAYPVDYPYPEKETFMLTLSVPDDYTVDEMPEDMVIALPGNAAIFSFTAKQLGNTIQLVMRTEIKKMKFLVQDYPHLREFFNQLVAKQQEQIVLKRK
uniref:Transglutaminase domain-containing protein n=1 Tax=Roseihalotalea indica TaxID=2867963 RepID=A0AA49GNQ7_9BACT|nr:transglutaminase domain-containing protein [Tunicatimonas sp. TK19036]